MTIYPGTSEKRRELDLCNVVFCTLVILIHVLAEPVSLYRRDSILYALVLGPWRLSSFVVQGFLFLAGVKAFLKNKPMEDSFSLLQYYIGRLHRVVLPYLGAAVLFSVYFGVLGQLHETADAWWWDVLTGRLVGHFYFVPVICQFYLLIPLWRHMVYRCSAILSLLTSLMIMLLCKLYLPDVITLLSGRAFTENAILCTTYLFYFVAGCYCGRYYTHFRAYLHHHARSIYIGCGISAVINWVFIVLNGRGIYYAPWLEVFHILYCIYAILTFLALADRYNLKHRDTPKLFQSVNRHSYAIYLLHPLFIFLINGFCNTCGIHSLSLRLVIRFMLTYLLSVFLIAVPFDRFGRVLRRKKTIPK